MSVLDVFIACAPFIGSWFSQQHGRARRGVPPPRGHPPAASGSV